MTDTDRIENLKAVAIASRALHMAREAYGQAIVLAHSAGWSHAEIARAAGTSRQAIRQLIERRGGN
jgi:DNA-directed RNA polymerase specialized sigma24 family protein